MCQTCRFQVTYWCLVNCFYPIPFMLHLSSDLTHSLSYNWFALFVDYDCFIQSQLIVSIMIQWKLCIREVTHLESEYLAIHSFWHRLWWCKHTTFIMWQYKDFDTNEIIQYHGIPITNNQKEHWGRFADTLTFVAVTPLLHVYSVQK